MFYYEVWIGSQRFHSANALTYSSDNKLLVGEVVEIPLRNQKAIGFVAAEVKPNSSLKDKVKSIITSTGIVLSDETRQLHDWLNSYYPAPSGTIANLILPSSLPKDVPINKSDKKPLELPPLTSEQKSALEAIAKSDSTSILLHGDTGTGKTRVYVELIINTLENNKSAVVLTPEIGLTPQLFRDLDQTFPGQVIVMHSNQTPAKRNKIWYQIAQSKEPLIIIGPRSALFAPLSNIGLIIVDEAHEQAYKQEQAPYYQATRVAAQLARLHRAKYIIGTATPLVADYYLFTEKKMPIIRMTGLATGEVKAPHVKIVDLKDPTERKTGIVTTTLKNKIDEHLAQNQQILLFLNRRGSARMVLCENCGWQALCPRCDIPLTYHSDQNLLRCHTCGFTDNIITSCRSCKSSDVIYNSPGTKSLEIEVSNLYPELIVKRFDSDNLAAEKLEKHYKELVSGEVDIIIGTQLVTKGLDLPKLGLVGIMNADASLNFPDYTTEEKTYQLLTQVIGRVGRHHQTTSVVVQTYNPTNPLLELSINKDWLGFYRSQLAERKQFGFPPFYHLLQLRISRSSRASVESASRQLAEKLKAKSGIALRGPSPQLHEKVRDKYNWQIIVSSKQRQNLLDIISDLPSGWQANIDPSNLL